MPFSRSISRIPLMISWLIALPLVDQIAPHDGVVRDVHFVTLGLQAERPLARRDAEPPPPPPRRPGRGSVAGRRCPRPCAGPPGAPPRSGSARACAAAAR